MSTNEEKKLDLKEIREEIDVIDKELVDLFEKRMELCRDVAEFKFRTGKAVLDREREHEKITTLTGYAKDDFSKHGIEELFTQIMSMSRKYQYRLLTSKGLKDTLEFTYVDRLWKDDVKVAYQGIPGAYSHEALRSYFGEYVDEYNVPTWRKAMEDIRDGRADYAVLPIENSQAGAVGDVYDLLMEFENYIVKYVDIKINHALLGVKGATMDDIKTVYSHPQAMMQSREFLEKYEWQEVAQSNTAIAAKKVSEYADKSKAAIASIKNASIYGLEVLAEHINTSDVNTTRFIILSRSKICKKDANKILISFEVAHESGSLYGALSHIIYNDVNMTKIESRPIPNKKWQYRFFIEVEGRVSDPGVVNALRGLNAETLNMKILGNY